MNRQNIQAKPHVLPLKIYLGVGGFLIFLYEGKIRFFGSVEELLNRGKNKNIESALAKLMEDLKG